MQWLWTDLKYFSWLDIVFSGTQVAGHSIWWHESGLISLENNFCSWTWLLWYSVTCNWLDLTRKSFQRLHVKFLTCVYLDIMERQMTIRNLMSSYRNYVLVKSSQVHDQKFHVQPQEQWNQVKCITGNSMSSYGNYFHMRSSQLYHQKFNVQLQKLFSTEAQPIALPESSCPAPGIIFHWNQASCITRNCMSSHRNYFPIKSS